MRYLIEIDGKLYGYDTPMILRIDSMVAKKGGCDVGRLYKRVDGVLTLKYEEAQLETETALKGGESNG